MKNKKYSQCTLQSWTKKELIEYIRMLETNYDNLEYYYNIVVENLDKCAAILDNHNIKWWKKEGNTWVIGEEEESGN